MLLSGVPASKRTYVPSFLYRRIGEAKGYKEEGKMF